MHLNQYLKYFLRDHFNGLTLKQPLFYNWPMALRFNLQHGEVGTTSYFQEVVHRATQLFEEVFEPADSLFFVLTDFRYKRRKIHFRNFCFQCIKQLKKNEISFSVLRQLYDHDKGDVYNRAVVLTTVGRLDVVSLLSAIAHKDFPEQHPQLGQEPLSSKDIYLINTSKRIIFHMYDDRGMDRKLSSQLC
ncbi:hypothetical protein GCM10023231_12350 [Olivibacter ginsenosidimutans]|uniref:DUF3885 domain-containing protein n=1 Tax=Olivibacter ginsenosidimutans TaxID=1176537 RepID=A0ABP9ATG1_9SPHI